MNTIAIASFLLSFDTQYYFKYLPAESQPPSPPSPPSMCPLTSGPTRYHHIDGLETDDLEAQSQQPHHKDYHSRAYSRSLPHSSSSSFIHPHPHPPQQHLSAAPQIIPPTLLPFQFTLHHGTDSLLSRNREFPQLLAEAGQPPSPALARSRKPSMALNNPQMRYMRLIGNSNPRYDWARYIKTEEELKAIKIKNVREYYARNNELIQIYLYVDRLLDSSLPQDLLETYHDQPEPSNSSDSSALPVESSISPKKVKKRPSYLYKIADESSPLLGGGSSESDGQVSEPQTQGERERVVRVAIYVNMAANIVLLAAKIVITLLTSSLSITASLVDGVMDLLSSTIIFIAAKLIERRNNHEYPVGRSRLEPISILVFSVIMITSFTQVGIESSQRLFSSDHSIVQLTPITIEVMAATVLIKGACWFAYRLVKNSSVQALAADAWTDVVFNIFSTLFPLIGFYAGLWWADPLGGLALSVYIIFNWGLISKDHIRHLTGAAAPPQIRNAILYMTMRFAKTIKQITAVQAYYAGDRLNVEIDLVLDKDIGLKDSHDLGESLQYVVESLPVVERAFVHLDYTAMNPYGHLH